MHISEQMNRENVVYVYNGILPSHNKKLNHVICRKKDETGDHIARLSEINQTQTDMYHIFIHM
jgi:hypothetical protein